MTYTELDDKVLALCNLAIEMAADDAVLKWSG